MVLNDAFPIGLMSRVEDASLNASAPPGQRLLDGWLIRLSPGKAKRARSVNAIAEGRLPLEERLALTRAAFDAAGLPLIIRITPFSPPGLDAALEAYGFRRFDDTRVMVHPALSDVQVPVLPGGCSLEPLPVEQFAELVGELRGSPQAQRAAQAERMAQLPVPCRGYVLRSQGEVVACGQMTTEADLVGLYDVFTRPDCRGRGFARALCERLIGLARSAGARVGYLQVDGDNTPARAVYQRLGFSDAYAYHYRTDHPSAQ